MTIKTLTGTRNGKTFSMQVEVTQNDGKDMWVKKADGKPIFGTTGYLNRGTDLTSYRGKVLASNITLTE